MISLPSGTRIWLVAGVTDMRKSFNGLGEQVQHVLDENPFSGAKWHLNRSQFGIRIDHDLASISDHSLASQSITIWHASDH